MGLTQVSGERRQEGAGQEEVTQREAVSVQVLTHPHAEIRTGDEMATGHPASSEAPGQPRTS